MTIERRIANQVRGVLSRAGLHSLDQLTHSQQFRLADVLRCNVPELHAAMRAAPAVEPAPRRAAPKVAPQPRARDVVGNVGDRLDEDQDLRVYNPAVLDAINELSDRIGLDKSLSPSLRRAHIDRHIKELHDLGRREVGTERGDRAWELHKRYKAILRDAATLDGARRTQRDMARASLNRQAAAARAASRKGAG